jgi:hypothetical protein
MSGQVRSGQVRSGEWLRWGILVSHHASAFLFFGC